MQARALNWTRNNNGGFIATTAAYRYRAAKFILLEGWGYDILSIKDGRIIQSGHVFDKAGAYAIAEHHHRKECRV